MLGRLPPGCLAPSPPARAATAAAPRRQAAQGGDGLRVPRVRDTAPRGPVLRGLPVLHAPAWARRELPVLRRTHHLRGARPWLRPRSDGRPTQPPPMIKTPDQSAGPSSKTHNQRDIVDGNSRQSRDIMARREPVHTGTHACAGWPKNRGDACRWLWIGADRGTVSPSERPESHTTRSRRWAGVPPCPR